MNRFLTIAAAILLAGLLGGCREEGTGDYVTLAGHIFVFNPRIASATYVVTLDKLKPLPEGAVAVARFENPAGGSDLEIREKVWPQLDKISLESPNLTCVKKDRRYRFSVALLDRDGAELQVISSTMLSTLDQSVMPDAPLVVGPAYEPNPDIKGDPAGKIAGTKKPSCPA